MKTYTDVSAIAQVIGCIFNNSSILDDTDKYIIREEDFVEDFHKLVFGSIYNIHLTNSAVTIETIIDYLSNRPKFETIFKKNRGVEYLLEASKNAQEESFNYYYNRLKKFTLLRAYKSFGLDVSFLYDPNEVLDVKKRQRQEDWLDNTSLAEIAGIIDKEIDKIKGKYIEDDLGVGYQAGDDVIELIEELERHPEIGIPLYGELINTVTRGARLRKFYLRSGATNAGKAIPNDTLIPTPNGWRRVGDIRPGDKIFGQDGKPTVVLQVHPQETKKDIWKITFSDGRIAECCGEHLWEYRYETHGQHKYRVEDIQTIYERTQLLKYGLRNDRGKGYRFHIKLNGCVEYPEKQLSLPPYVMGAFLGDGSFRYSNNNKSLCFSSQDIEILDFIVSDLNETESGIDSWTYVKNSGKNYNWTFRKNSNPNHPIWVEEFLKSYPELWNLKSEKKFIPRDYLESTYTQRIRLLQGLLDTDGTIDKKGVIRFTTISPMLRDNVIELSRSLGFIATYAEDKRKEKYTTGTCYTVYIQCKKKDKPSLFRLSRKFNIAKEYSESNIREEYKDHLAIANIEKTNVKADMTCFTVDSADHLFLMKDFIVTHNTRSMIADACNFACNRIYHEQFGWIKNGGSHPTLYITTEQDKSEVQTMMLAFLSNVNEEHILNGLYLEGERERVIEAGRILKDSPLWIEELPDFSLDDVENKIKKYVREHNVTYFVYDYIHTSLKILEEITRKTGGVRLREDNILFMLSTRLKDLANKYGIFILSGTQLNGDFKTSDTPDQNLLRGKHKLCLNISYPILPMGVTYCG